MDVTDLKSLFDDSRKRMGAVLDHLDHRCAFILTGLVRGVGAEGEIRICAHITTLPGLVLQVHVSTPRESGFGCLALPISLVGAPVAQRIEQRPSNP